MRNDEPRLAAVVDVYQGESMNTDDNPYRLLRWAATDTR